MTEPTPTTEDELRDRLEKAFAPSRLDIVDESHHHRNHPGAREGGRHYRVLLVSEAFTGKPLVERHRMVHEAVGELMRGPIHALALRTRTPDEG